MAEPKAPKFEIKMLALPAMLFLSKKIDMKDPKNVQMAQAGLVAITVLMLTIHYYVYSCIQSSKNGDKKIWVPPKPKPTLPFNIGPPPEPIKIEEFEATTYKEYETKLLKESGQSALMSAAISLFMSYKFNVHVSVLIQAAMMPLNAVESPILKKYLLGSKAAYNELDTAPTAAIVDEINRKSGAIAATAATATPSTGSRAAGSSGAAGENEPRVVEITDEEYKKEKEAEKKKKQKESGKSVNDIDD